MHKIMQFYALELRGNISAPPSCGACQRVGLQFTVETVKDIELEEYSCYGMQVYRKPYHIKVFK